jgi:hypothetical protein
MKRNILATICLTILSFIIWFILFWYGIVFIIGLLFGSGSNVQFSAAFLGFPLAAIMSTAVTFIVVRRYKKGAFNLAISKFTTLSSRDKFLAVLLVVALSVYFIFGKS